jgi:hypothetical protein
VNTDVTLIYKYLLKVPAFQVLLGYIPKSGITGSSMA